MSALSAIAGKKHKGIETKEYTDYYGGFESKKKNLVMSGVFDTEDKYLKLDFFLANFNDKLPQLEKGEPRKILCSYIEYLLKKKILQRDFEFRLYADPNYGSNLRDDIGKTKRTLAGLVKMYESMTFKKFGEVAFGNQPMKTTVGEFLDWCKSKHSPPKKPKKTKN